VALAVEWTEAFLVFLVTHLVGDFGLQTEWQAEHKRGGLGADRTARRALFAHVAVYTLVFVPALAWLWDDIGAGAFAVGAAIFATHLVQDDGTLLDRYAVHVKRTDPRSHPAVMVAVDQTLHVVVLFVLALAASA
jgi:hypothetical protein